MAAATSTNLRPPPPLLANGEPPQYYDDEESGYQYYLDDAGVPQWDTYGYYDEEGFYHYYCDEEEEEEYYEEWGEGEGGEDGSEQQWSQSVDTPTGAATEDGTYNDYESGSSYDDSSADYYDYYEGEEGASGEAYHYGDGSYEDYNYDEQSNGYTDHYYEDGAAPEYQQQYYDEYGEYNNYHAPSPPATVSVPEPVNETPEERKARHRIEAMKEIIKTERDYVADLQLLIDRYMHPLVQQGIIDKLQSNTIFSTMPTILGVNTQLLHGLLSLDEQTWRTPQGEHIADLFLKTMHYFKMYSTYCSNYSTAVTFTNTLFKKNAAFVAFCDAAKASTNTRLDIIDLLIKPVQRICKYPLLFKEVIRNTDESDPDYAKLTEVMDKLGEVAEHVNESKRNAENLQIVMQIAQEITDVPSDFSLVAPNRQFVFRGVFPVIIGNSKSSKSSHLLLFNDLIIHAKAIRFTKKLKIKHMFNVRSVIVRDLPPLETATGTEVSCLLHQLELEDGVGKDMIILTVQFKDPTEKDKWRDAISTEKNYLQNEELAKLKSVRKGRSIPLNTSSSEGGAGGLQSSSGGSARLAASEKAALRTIGGSKSAVNTLAEFRNMKLGTLRPGSSHMASSPLLDSSLRTSQSELVKEDSGRMANLDKLKGLIAAEKEKLGVVETELQQWETKANRLRLELQSHQQTNADLEKEIEAWKRKAEGKEEPPTATTMTVKGPPPATPPTRPNFPPPRPPASTTATATSNMVTNGGGGGRGGAFAQNAMNGGGAVGGAGFGRGGSGMGVAGGFGRGRGGAAVPRGGAGFRGGGAGGVPRGGGAGVGVQRGGGGGANGVQRGGAPRGGAGGAPRGAGGFAKGTGRGGNVTGNGQVRGSGGGMANRGGGVGGRGGAFLPGQGQVARGQPNRGAPRGMGTRGRGGAAASPGLGYGGGTRGGGGGGFGGRGGRGGGFGVAAGANQRGGFSS
ncbi:histone H3 domain-containing protein [Balamuthia mandrillaris]